MGCLEERSKVGKGRKRGGSERSKWVKTEERGDTKGQLHVKQLLVSILIQSPHLITATSQLNSLLNELCECAPCSPCGHDPLANFKFAGPSRCLPATSSMGFLVWVPATGGGQALRDSYQTDWMSVLWACVCMCMCVCNILALRLGISGPGLSLTDEEDKSLESQHLHDLWQHHFYASSSFSLHCPYTFFLHSSDALQKSP